MRVPWRFGLMLAAGALVGACSPSPVAPGAGQVIVANYTHEAASVSWPTPGFFGTPLGAGTDTRSLGPCNSNDFGFWPGDYPVTITSATDSLTFVLHAPPQGGVVVTYVIDGTGHIALVGNEANDSPMPQNGACPPY